jgi:hypothetical protein
MSRVITNTLMFTLTSPTTMQPYIGTYNSPGQIVIDITKSVNSNNSFPSTYINATEDINMIHTFPPNSTFDIISYSGVPLFLYDINGNDISKTYNYSLVKKIVAGISNAPSTSTTTSTNSSSSNIGLILGIVFGILFFIGIGVYIFRNKLGLSSKSSNKSSSESTNESAESAEPPDSAQEEPNNLESKTGGYFRLGE